MIFTLHFVYAQYGGNAITAADQALLLKYHNIARAQVGSPPLTWDTTLEQAAVKCLQEKRPSSLTHGICKDQPALANVGENLAQGTNINGAKAALMFIGEKCEAGGSLASYTSSFSGGSSAGHYTQVVWKGSKTMSCAMLQVGSPIYCHYSPAGNMMGASAYSKPPPTSDCNGGQLNEAEFGKGSPGAYTPPSGGSTPGTGTTPPSSAPNSYNPSTNSIPRRKCNAGSQLPISTIPDTPSPVSAPNSPITPPYSPSSSDTSPDSSTIPSSMFSKPDDLPKYSSGRKRPKSSSGYPPLKLASPSTDSSPVSSTTPISPVIPNKLTNMYSKPADAPTSSPQSGTSMMPQTPNSYSGPSTAPATGESVGPLVPDSSTPPLGTSIGANGY